LYLCGSKTHVKHKKPLNYPLRKPFVPFIFLWFKNPHNPQKTFKLSFVKTLCALCLFVVQNPRKTQKTFKLSFAKTLCALYLFVVQKPTQNTKNL
jgi:hypothetical protein